MTAARFTQIVEIHQGTVTADNEQGMYRVGFASFQRLAGFYDEMVSRRFETTIEADAVVVQL